MATKYYQIKGLKNGKTFINELITDFSQISEEILDEDCLGLISLQIGCFTRFTQKAIDNNDLETVKKCFDFIDANVDCVEYSVENSIVISYLGKSKVIKNSQVDRLLSLRLKQTIEELNTYYASASKNEKVNRFLDDFKKDEYLE